MWHGLCQPLGFASRIPLPDASYRARHGFGRCSGVHILRHLEAHGGSRWDGRWQAAMGKRLWMERERVEVGVPIDQHTPASHRLLTDHLRSRLAVEPVDGPRLNGLVKSTRRTFLRRTQAHLRRRGGSVEQGARGEAR
eukprot:CAMPEP_0185207830 /NCGR_PEP_ID=MMETSP1140-20130426/60997_1 /TAXON_ID=298111 /ORGANISM="Pavlova sp., Strain CCMP459" /LENGTH=137 /DNA_ID=CAMNT_0027775525 /DNA_START=124 /DNA_END=534 /DNA_ORIENTATION=+